MKIIFKIGSRGYNNFGWYLITNIKNGELIVRYDDTRKVEILTLATQERIIEKKLASGELILNKNGQLELSASDRHTKLLTEYNVSSLYYMAHISKALSIITNGIYCRELARLKNLIQPDFADPAVQKLRYSREGIDVHRHVPLYFTFDTPMRHLWLFSCSPPYNSISADDVVFFVLSAIKVFCLKNIRVATGNAASDGSYVCPNVALAFANIDWDAIRSHGIGPHKERQAEVLVSEHVPPDLIDICIVNSQVIARRLRAELKKRATMAIDKSPITKPDIKCDNTFYQRY